MGSKGMELQTATRGLLALYDFGIVPLQSKMNFSKADKRSWGALQSFVFQAVIASLCSRHCFGSYIVWILAVRKEWLHVLPFSTHRGRGRKVMRSSPLWAVMRSYKTKKQYTPK